MSSPLPPPPEQRSKSKPIWKQWWFWAIVVVVLLIAAGVVGSSETTDTEAEAGSPSPVTTATQPTPSPTPETELVPDVGEESVDVATSELEGAGFIVSVETRLTNSAPKGTVLHQSEPAGSSVELGGTITLTVAQPLPKIPNVVGKTLANAKRALQNAGFEIGKVTQQTSSKKKGTVISQSPDAGTSARPGRAISLVTAKPAPQPSSNCTPGYSPCLPPASDYDCLGGTGDGPEYTGFVRVTGSDPYDLDGDGDGFGCE
jgi:hypothetical protein